MVDFGPGLAENYGPIYVLARALILVREGKSFDGDLKLLITNNTPFSDKEFFFIFFTDNDTQPLRSKTSHNVLRHINLS